MVINLNDFDKIKKFANIVSLYEEPIEISKVDGSAVYSAKSILSLFCMDLSSPLNVRIITPNEKTINEFNTKMEEFI